MVELPGAKEVERVKGLLQSTAQLEFWDAFKGEEFASFLFQANEVLKEVVDTSDEVDSDKTDEDSISDIIGDTDASVSPIISEMESSSVLSESTSSDVSTTSFKTSLAWNKKLANSSPLKASQNSSCAVLWSNPFTRSTSLAPGNSTKIRPELPIRVLVIQDVFWSNYQEPKKLNV